MGKKQDIPNLEHLFFHLKFNPLPEFKTRYFISKKIIFMIEDYERMRKNSLLWADKLIFLILQQTHITMEIIKRCIKMVCPICKKRGKNLIQEDLKKDRFKFLYKCRYCKTLFWEDENGISEEEEGLDAWV